MVIEYAENELDIVDKIANEDGYRFAAKGDISEQKVRDWVAIVSERLRKENIIKSMSDIQSVIIVQDSKRVLKDKKPAEDMKIVSLFDFCEDINITIIYLILDGDKVIDNFNMQYIMPLVLDCETIDSLFDTNGEYVGSQRNIEDYMQI